jgi:CelD/BcsL family acetyltransferase involved in cellulose biosynthesis
VLEEGHGYDCVYLEILSGDELVGVFPSIAVRHGSRRLVSQPFNEYGGPLMDGLSGPQYQELTRLLFDAAAREGCGSIEIRGGVGCDKAAEAGRWRVRTLHSYGVLPLEEKARMWRKSLTNEARKGVNRAQKAGLTAEVLRGASAIQEPFYRMYLVSMKRLGVPPQPERFFTALAQGMGERLVAVWVRKGREPAAVLLGVMAGTRLQIYVTASDPNWWEARPNDLAHWELITWAHTAGCRVFDFGSARYPGQIQFKKKWGVQLQDYSVYVINSPGSASTARIATVDSSSRAMTLMADLWRRLVPLGMTRVLGPAIRKYLTK